MFFRPDTVNATWDTWMFHDGSKWYLYYLITERSPGEGFGVAVSDDGVIWRNHGTVLHMRPEADWLGTGAVWRSPDFDRDGQFVCNFSEWVGPRQTILFAESKNLLEWRRCGADTEFAQDPRWYEPEGRWDCIYPLPRPQGGYWGYWTATPRERVGWGFGETDDGVHWRALEPPAIEWGDTDPFPPVEAGAVEEIGGRYYAMIGAFPPAGGGMWTFVADRPEGPFRPASRNFGLLISGAFHNHTYFARFCRTPDGLLVNHHAITRHTLPDTGRWICHLGLLKRALVDEEGSLRLGWWAGNNRLKERKTTPPALANPEAKGPVFMLAQRLDADRGFVLEGTLPLATTRADPETDLGVAVGCAAKASSEYGQGHEASRAFDGKTDTRWASAEPYGGEEWLEVDLGETVEVRRIRLVWEKAFALSYSIIASEDGERWRTIHRNPEGRGGVEHVTKIEEPCRYLRLQCLERGSQHGFSLYEFAVFTKPGNPLRQRTLSGLYVEDREWEGMGFLVSENAVTEVGRFSADGSSFRVEQRIDRDLPPGCVAEPGCFRLILKGELLELYIDELLITCYSLPGNATGRVGLIARGVAPAVREWKAWLFPEAPAESAT